MVIKKKRKKRFIQFDAVTKKAIRDQQKVKILEAAPYRACTAQNGNRIYSYHFVTHAVIRILNGTLLMK